MKRLFAAACVLVLAALPAAAQELTGTLKKIKETGAITIGYREESVPFSYLDDQQKPIGFAMDICHHIADAVKQELKLDKLDIKLVPVTSSNRIPLMANGTIDLECGSTTNNAARQQQVWFTNTHYLTASVFVSKKANNLNKIDDLKGKTIVSTAGTTNIRQANTVNSERNLGMTILAGNDHADGFLMMETGRAAAFVMDDIIIAGLIANSKTPDAYQMSPDAFSLPEPYGIMLRKDDVPFKQVADRATAELYRSPEMAALWDKWFNQPIPPHNINLRIPMSPAMKKNFANPSSSPDPKDY